jgi:hypothetical protein
VKFKVTVKHEKAVYEIYECEAKTKEAALEKAEENSQPDWTYATEYVEAIEIAEVDEN